MDNNKFNQALELLKDRLREGAVILDGTFEKKAIFSEEDVDYFSGHSGPLVELCADLGSKKCTEEGIIFPLIIAIQEIIKNIKNNSGDQYLTNMKKEQKMLCYLFSASSSIGMIANECFSSEGIKNIGTILKLRDKVVNLCSNDKQKEENLMSFGKILNSYTSYRSSFSFKEYLQELESSIDNRELTAKLRGIKDVKFTLNDDEDLKSSMKCFREEMKITSQTLRKRSNSNIDYRGVDR